MTDRKFDLVVFGVTMFCVWVMLPGLFILAGAPPEVILVIIPFALPLSLVLAGLVRR